MNTKKIFDDVAGGAQGATGPAGYVDGAGFWHPKGVTLIPMNQRPVRRDWDPFSVDGSWQGPLAPRPKK